MASVIRGSDNFDSNTSIPSDDEKVIAYATWDYITPTANIKFGFSSVTETGTGTFTFNFTTPQNSHDYAVAALADGGQTTGAWCTANNDIGAQGNYGRTTTQVGIRVYEYNGSYPPPETSGRDFSVVVLGKG